MKKHETEIRSKEIHFRLKQAEYNKMEALRKQSNEKSLSNYLRKVALKKPVLVTYRNASADAFLLEMVELKDQLRILGNTYGLAVRTLRLLEKIPDFKAWIQQYENSRQSLLAMVKDIHSKVIQLYEQWLQK